MYQFTVENDVDLILHFLQPRGIDLKRRWLDGFTYFEATQFGQGSYFVVASIASGEPVGLLKFGWFPDQYWGIGYIDVKKEHRGKKVARRLIQTLDTHLEPGSDVVSSPIATRLGRKAKMHDVLRRYLLHHNFYAGYEGKEELMEKRKEL